MKKIIFFVMLSTTLCYGRLLFSDSSETVNPELHWSGFYLGGNAGYWWSQSDEIVTTATSRDINQTFVLGASNIANALAEVATNNFSLNPNGFIGGGQAGYNYLNRQGILLGLEIDFNGLTNSNNTYTSEKIVNLYDFDESYVRSFMVKQNINYLGTVRARLGYQYRPTVLVYVTGGFAYGNITLDTTWTAEESLGPSVFPIVHAQNDVTQTVPGWTVGAGLEWLFKKHWSAKLEYTYYDLNDLDISTTLTQINHSLSPPVLWGSAVTNTDLSVSMGIVRVGVNYHF